jgi:hypothetical protein
LTIAAQSEPARSSNVLQLNVQENMPAFVTVIAPTVVPTETAQPASAGATPTPEGGSGDEQGEGRGAGFGGLLVGLIGGAGVSALAYRYGPSPASTSRGRAALVTLVASLLGYNYVALGFPGAAGISQTLGVLAPGAIGVAAGLASWGCWRLVNLVARKRAQKG